MEDFISPSGRTTTRVPLSKCPNCGYKLDACTATKPGPDVRPSPGDASVCYRCGEILVFDERLRIVRPTPQQLAELRASKKLWRILERASLLRRTEWRKAVN